MRAIIIANGLLTNPEQARMIPNRDDLIIAADGGCLHCLTLGLTPQVIVGDMDSIPADTLKSFEMTGTEIVRHEARKDQTDLELALQLALDRGARQVVVLAALGLRWDMTLANVMLLGADMKGIDMRLIDGPQEITVIRGGGSLNIHGRPGDTMSLIPIGSEARGVYLEGFEYPLIDATLSLGSTWGISNVLAGELGTIRLEHGLLLCVHIRSV